MNVVDSCGWLECFSDGGNADFFTQVLERTENADRPESELFEVCKRVALQRGEAAARQAAEFMAKPS